MPAAGFFRAGTGIFRPGPVIVSIMVLLIWGILPAFAGEENRQEIFFILLPAAASVLFLTAVMSVPLPRILFTGRPPFRHDPEDPPAPATLAGMESMESPELIAKVLETDPDPQLLTRRNGTVVYANHAYCKLSADMNTTGPAGLPARVDRLFSERGTEATKIFRLGKASRSGSPAEEIIACTVLPENTPEKCRYRVSVRPVGPAGNHMAWKLREMTSPGETRDILHGIYQDFPSPVFFLERSGVITWANTAMYRDTGTQDGRIDSMNTIVPGDSTELVSNLWKADSIPREAGIRTGHKGTATGQFRAFRRGGIGEGFVCVTLDIHDIEETPPGPSLSGDMSGSPFGVAIIEGDLRKNGRLVEANRAFTDAFPGARKKISLSNCFPSSTLKELAGKVKPGAKSGTLPSPVEVNTGEGSMIRTFALYARAVQRKRGAYGPRRIILYSVDITDSKRMEQDYAQDQKLRGVGVMASRVAHDFNNYLQVILGYCERLMLRHPAGDPAYRDLVQISQNAQRAANTTKQMLAFSSRQTLRREVISITELLRDFSRFLDRATGEKTRLRLVNGRGVPPVRVDRGQLENVFMNLAVNARDAMGPAGGILKISTRFVSAENIKESRTPGLEKRDHVVIEVEDTGPGIPPAIADKIFDPFFTTKETGRGTGLGLSTVYGVIRQMEGTIILTPERENGAKFRIYLPAFHDTAGNEESDSTVAPTGTREPQDLTGAGRILVIEDEDPVRTFVVSILEDCGYQVMQTSNGEEALEIMQENPDFDLVLSDVMMPDLDGPSVIVRARREYGLNAKIIFMSGYAETAVRDQLGIIRDAKYVQKPFTLKSIATMVKKTLGESADPVPDTVEQDRKKETFHA